MVPLGFKIACLRASCPTSRSPASVNAATDGVVREPSALGITVGFRPPSPRSPNWWYQDRYRLLLPSLPPTGLALTNVGRVRCKRRPTDRPQVQGSIPVPAAAGTATAHRTLESSTPRSSSQGGARLPAPLVL